MKNGIAMGGPFVSVTALNEKENKIITVEGFVFAAGEDKRNYVRQLDAIVLSLAFPDVKNEQSFTTKTTLMLLEQVIP